MATQLQLGLKFREGYSVPVREELDQLVASLNAQVPASISSAIAAIPPAAPSDNGVWIPIPFVAANFSASGSMTWTVASGGQLLFQYMLIGKTCWVMFDISGTIAGTVNTSVIIKPPVVTVISISSLVQPILTSNPTWQYGNGLSGLLGITITRDVTFAANWAAGTGRVVGTVMYPIA